MQRQAPRVVLPTSLDRLFPARLRDHDDDDPVGPLWRAAQIFRFASYLYALGFQIGITHDLVRPGVTWALFAVLTLANLWWAAGYLVGFGRHWWFVAVELAVCVVMMGSTAYVADAAWIDQNQTWPTTLWMANAVVSAALLGGPLVGMGAGVVIALANYWVKGYFVWNFGRNATTVLLLTAGMAIGLAAARARATHQQLTAAIRTAAQAGERERLAREVHDGVLQVLALVARRAPELGGDGPQLGALAAQQEQRLRRLVADGEQPPPPVGAEDLGALLRSFTADGVSVSCPGEPVTVPVGTAREIGAAVRNLLDNTQQHAGPGARSFVLLEDLDQHVVVTVRDDGAGIADGRLDHAQAEGRMGVSRSVVGRIEALGGRAQLTSAPGEGTEWELTVPTAGEPR
ncbi:ATP-binding protein [Branchiibius sp. NY16-3462-2]|uniref:MacS family sensor histidine kinase n=1 Tax=Branchiibius sp. NY16-3462-2 TaxID=1807500 RepID=UPI000794C542|nr:ATP-binding protein [Branchiibius sp. NY16-3462-2]KYH45347.1 ATP-binding protein [Branchiibius sp. NY16-3462-2]